MGKIDSGKVLVTGASGYIGAWTAKYALDAGYITIATVRSEDKGNYLKKQYGNNPKFDYVIVKDIAQPDAFDQCFKTHSDIDAVLHTASPFHFQADDPQELIKPAVEGTTAVLKAIQKYSPKSVKRVVITSSIAAIMDSTKAAPYTFTEKDWNENSAKIVEEQGRDAPGNEKYRASKVLAEKAAWKFKDEQKPSWDMVFVNPSLVEGPVLHPIPNAESINTSTAMFYNVMKNGCKELPKGGPNGCDVRDVAWAHVRAIQVEEAVNHRFIISIGPTAYQQWTEWLKANVPDWPFDAGKPGDVQKSIDPKNAVVFDGSLTENVLGFKYRHWDETTKDMYYSLVEREKAGWP